MHGVFRQPCSGCSIHTKRSAFMLSTISTSGPTLEYQTMSKALSSIPQSVCGQSVPYSGFSKVIRNVIVFQRTGNVLAHEIFVFGLGRATPAPRMLVRYPSTNVCCETTAVQASRKNLGKRMGRKQMLLNLSPECQWRHWSAISSLLAPCCLPPPAAAVLLPRSPEGERRGPALAPLSSPVWRPIPRSTRPAT